MIDRREFIRAMAGGLLLAATGKGANIKLRTELENHPTGGTRSKVALVKTSDRTTGIGRCIDLLGSNPVKGKAVLLKPNFNTADPYPASTHIDTLTHLIRKLRKMGAEKITIGERSGPPDTADVLKEKGIYDLCRELEVGLINFEDLTPEDWVQIQPENSHWRQGFKVARPVLEAEAVVTTCCLKTHRYGGVFTMSLKLAVGITHKRNMRELHSSFLDMRKMIAEINQAYSPALILMDGLVAFTDGGPARGTRREAGVLLAGDDRIAIDAVGVAILKELGSVKAIMNKGIFEQEQIARAVELGLGVGGPEAIEIVTDDETSRAYAARLREILLQG